MVLLCFKMVPQPIHRNFKANSIPITARASNSKVPCIPTGNFNLSIDGFSARARDRRSKEEAKSKP